ncbi:hypothetical protein [Amycolatopsis echigonensis]|uniref:hypothetical protein n=1 Tax=Amycolatopsis echigonensis TaxID=2576905 RepID=UPI000C708AA2
MLDHQPGQAVRPPLSSRRAHTLRSSTSPPLDWTPPPAGTVELVRIVQDPDVPLRKPATHALARGLDRALGGIPENGRARLEGCYEVC